MMDKIILESAIYRFFALCLAWCRGSAIAGFFAALKRQYMDSKVRKLCIKMLDSPRYFVYSGTYKGIHGFWQSFDRLFKQFDSYAKGSLILGKINLRRVLIFCFVMYLPIDYFLRNVVQISGISSIWDEGFLVLAILWLIYDRMRNPQRQTKLTPVHFAILLFVALSLLIMVIPEGFFEISVAGFRAVCQFMAWFFVMLSLFDDRSHVVFFYFSFCLLGVLIGLHGIYQFIVGAPMPANWVAASEVSLRTRVYSIFGSPNVMGSFCLMLTPMLLGLAYYFKSITMRLLAVFGTVILLLATVFTFSRGAWFGLAVAAFVFALLVDRRLLFVGLIGCVGLMFIPAIANRIGFLFTSDFAAANSNGGRGQRWATGLNLLWLNPYTGMGLGRFGGAIAMQNQIMDGFKYFYMDNYYLKTLVEMGFIGLFGYLSLLFTAVLSSFRAIYKTLKTREYVLVSAMLSGVIGVLAHSYFENIFEVPYMNAYFWGIIAAISFFYHKRKGKEYTK